MKWRNYFSMLALAALAWGGASCSDDDPDPTPEPMAVSFAAESVSANYSIQEGEDLSFPVKVTRKVTAQAATIPVSVVAGAADFQVPSSVAFAAGSNAAEFTVVLTNNAAGTHTLEIALTGDNVASSGTTAKFEVTVTANEDPEPEPEPEPEPCMTVYFPSDNVVSYEFAEDDDAATMAFEVSVARVVADEAASVPVTVVSGAEAFTVPATVEFAAGEAAAKINVALVQPVAAGNYTLELALEGDDVDPEADVNGTTTLSISVVVNAAEGEEPGDDDDEEVWETFEGYWATYYDYDNEHSCTIKHLVGTDRYWIGGFTDEFDGFECYVDWTKQDYYEGYYLGFVASDYLVYSSTYGGYNYYTYAGGYAPYMIFEWDEEGYGSSVYEEDTELGLYFYLNVYDYVATRYDAIYVYTY